MKRYLRGFVAIIATLALTSSVAYATDPEMCSEADISHTGPGSVNKVECEIATDIRVKCVNNVYVVTDNSQTANSGNATSGGNTTGGGATSGNAVNENGTTVRIGASCGTPAVVTPEAPTPPKPGGGMGAVTPASQQPTQPAGGAGAVAPSQSMGAIATLPNTSSNPVLDSALLAGTGLTGMLVTSWLGTAAYRRFLLR